MKIRLIRLLAVVLACAVLLCGCAVVRYTDGVNVYILPNTVKHTQAEKLYKNGESLSVSLAKNEAEGMQFVLKDSENAFTVTDITVSDLSCDFGTIPSDDIEIFYQHYANVYRSTNINMGAGMYADALIPMQYADSIAVNAGENQGFWLTVHTTADTPAGNYTGTVTVKTEVDDIIIEVNCTVWDFAIPEKVNCVGAYGLWYVNEYAGQSQQYYDFFRQYRLTPRSLPTFTNDVAAYIDANIDIMESDDIPAFQIPLWHHFDENSNIIIEENSYILYNELVSRGLLDKAYIYVFDEPYGEAQINNVIKASRVLAEEFPGLRQVVAAAFKTEEFGFVNHADTLALMHQHTDEALIEKYRSTVDFWWYNCNVPDYDAPTLHIEDKLVSARLISWMQKDYNIGAFLYWSATMNGRNVDDAGNRNIWEDPFLGTDSYSPAGDGMIVYQAREGDGIVNANVPIPTVRLEALRDGSEDYEYLFILENKYKALIEKYNITDIDIDDIMESYYDALYVYTSDYDDDYNKVLKIRERVAHDIMQSDDVLCSVVLNARDGDGEVRELRVYAPDGCDVSAEGINLTYVNGYYSAFIDASYSHTVKIHADDAVYERTVAKIDRYEYDMYNRLAALESSVSVSSVIGYDSEKAQNRFDIYIDAPDGAEITLNGETVTDGHGILCFTKRACAYTVTVNYDGSTRVLRRFAVSDVAESKTLVDLEKQETVDAIRGVSQNKYGSFSNIRDGVLSFTLGRDAATKIKLPTSSIEISDDASEYKYIRFYMKNTSDTDKNGFLVRVVSGLANVELGQTGLIKAGEATAICLKIPTATDGVSLLSTVSSILFYSSANETQSYEISNLCIMK